MALARWPALPSGMLLPSLVVGALLGVIPTASAHVGKRQGLTFQDTRPIPVTFEEAARGPRVTFCNLDSHRAIQIRGALTGFRLERNGELIPDEELWRDVGARRSLRRGRCDKVRVARKPEAEPVDAGEYTGILAVTSAGSGGARRRVVLTVPEPKAAATPKAVPLSDPTAFTAKKWGPLDRLTLNDGRLPLKRAKPGGPPLQLPDPDTLVGTISKGTDVGSVYVDGDPVRRSGEGFVLLPLRIGGVDHVGEYAGTLDLAPAGAAEPQEVKISVSVTDWWGWAVGAALLGAGLGWLSQWWWRRMSVKRNLDRRLDGLRARYDEAAKEMHARVGYRRIKPPTDKAVAAYIADVRQAMKVDMDSSWYFEPDKPAYKSIDESIARAEDDADLLGSKAGLGRDLDQLRDALDRLASEAGELTVERRPAVLAAANAVFKEGRLKVGEATARAATAREFRKLVEELTAAIKRIQMLRPWAAALYANSRTNPNWTEADGERLFRAWGKVHEAENEILDVTDAEALRRLGAGGDLDAAYGSLAVLGGMHGVWWTDAPPEQPAPTAMRLAFAPEVANAARAGEEVSALLGELLTRAARAAVLHKTLGKVADWAFLGLAAVTAVFGSLIAFYFGQPWGSTVDYLTVIVAGTGTQLITSGIEDVLTRRTVGNRSARVAAKPEAAAVTARPAPTAD